LDLWLLSTVVVRAMPDLDTWRRARSVESRQKGSGSYGVAHWKKVGTWLILEGIEW
jgi:hypothetical protein